MSSSMILELRQFAQFGIWSLNAWQACDAAKEFSATNYGLIVDCISEPESIAILISQPNPNRFLRTFFSSIYASSRAGIVAENSLDSVD